jgi:hypothetical protein
MPLVSWKGRGAARLSAPPTAPFWEASGIRKECQTHARILCAGQEWSDNFKTPVEISYFTTWGNKMIKAAPGQRILKARRGFLWCRVAPRNPIKN